MTERARATIPSSVRRTKRSAAPLPSDFRAQLALLTKVAPAGDRWLHEIKLDGYRIGARIDGHDIRLISRNGNSWTAKFPTIRAGLQGLPCQRALLDGEVAVLRADGSTSFQSLQNAIADRATDSLVYFVFDLLHLDGEEIAALALLERKRRLRQLLAGLPPDSPIRYCDHVIGNGAEFLKQAGSHQLEGIISKRTDLPYLAGRRGGWLKIKFIRRQEFVVGGFTDPEGSRSGIGALLIGIPAADGRLTFAGKVGTGFTQKSALELRRQLDRLRRKECPFEPRPAGILGRRAHWVAPKLVAEVAFGEWTQDGKARHPSFQGLRPDKRPSEVVREPPAL